MASYPPHTAPQDGTFILMWTDHPDWGVELHVARWDGGSGQWVARLPWVAVEGDNRDAPLVDVVPIGWAEIPRNSFGGLS